MELLAEKESLIKNHNNLVERRTAVRIDLTNLQRKSLLTTPPPEIVQKMQQHKILIQEISVTIKIAEELILGEDTALEPEQKKVVN